MKYPSSLTSKLRGVHRGVFASACLTVVFKNHHSRFINRLPLEKIEVFQEYKSLVTPPLGCFKHPKIEGEARARV